MRVRSDRSFIDLALVSDRKSSSNAVTQRKSATPGLLFHKALRPARLSKRSLASRDSDGSSRFDGREPSRRCYLSEPMTRGNLSELIFLVEEAPEGGFTARALGESIFTEADSVASLHERVRDAVRCHFEEGQAPKVIRLHFVREEIISA